MRQRLHNIVEFCVAHRPHRLSLGAAGCALVFAIVAQTAEASVPALKSLKASIETAASTAATPEPAPTFSLVFEGRDIDGDGAADFANPTGLELRDHDAFGYGQFGARRDGGAREHEGADYIGGAGQDVVAPISGEVTRMGLAYAGADLKYVEITNPATGYEARVFYVHPSVAIGDKVAVGATIGTLHSLQSRYPGITDHVHLEVMQRGVRFDAAKVIVARLVRDDQA